MTASRLCYGMTDARAAARDGQGADGPALASPLDGRGTEVYVRAGILPLIGIGPCAVDKAVMTAREKSGTVEGRRNVTSRPGQWNRAAPLHPSAHVPKENARTSPCPEHVA
ncbi:hypothetical protein ABZ154_08005 [Streptomyces sp. NPDC006261]|uniref:hypothetical protein n=1 Tax=Streptomyces sp. NPDC006261 TaxID=3156739 RepID=UPI0033B31488